MDGIIRTASEECVSLLNSQSADIERAIKNPLLLRSLRALPIYLQQHNRCSMEEATEVYCGILLEALFRYKIFQSMHIWNQRHARYLDQKFNDHMQEDNVLSSAYPEITSHPSDRQTFGFLQTDPENPCQLFYCCSHHGWQLKATRAILDGTICTFYDGFRSMYRRCQTVSSTSNVYTIPENDWLTRSGEFSHTLNLQNNHGMLDGRFLLPTDVVGFGSFFNAHAQHNVQFVYGKHTTHNKKEYYVARLQANQDIPQGSLLTANYNFASFEAAKTKDFLVCDCNPTFKAYLTAHYTRLAKLVQCSFPDE